MPTEPEPPVRSVGRTVLRALPWAVAGAAVAAAGALAAVRLGDPHSRRLLELVTLTPLGLPLAVVGALAALLLLLVSARHRVAGLAFVAALALAAVHTWWLAPLYVGDAVAAGPSSIVVMSLNFEVGDAHALAAAAGDHDVDVLVLLEVSRAQMDEVRAAGLTTRLPHVAGVEEDEVSGAVVLSRFPVATWAPLYDGADSLRVELDVPVLDRVTVVAVHTRPPYQPGAWRADHDRTLAALTRLPTDGAELLAGDFNATLAHAPMRRILDLGFADAADQAGAGWSPTWPAGGQVRRLGVAVPAFAPIDHVLTSPPLVVTAVGTLEVTGADHRAVLASVSRAAR